MQDKLEQIQKLKEKYRDSFSNKKNQTEDYIKLIMESQENINETVLNDVHEYMHKLSGSSGMYGYADIAKIARGVMSLCKASNGKSINSDLVDLLSQLSNLLEQYIKG